MRLLRLIAVLIIAGLAGGAGEALASVLIEVDKATQRMTVSLDGEEVHSWPVSTGLPGYLTPTGSYTPFRMEEDHYSKEWDEAPMPHSIFFTGRGHAIHGSDVIRKLGSPASHGCIRLSRENAATLFDLVSLEGLSNTKVVVKGEEAIVTARKQRERRLAARRAAENRAFAGLFGSQSVQPYYPQGYYAPSYSNGRRGLFGWGW